MENLEFNPKFSMDHLIKFHCLQMPPASRLVEEHDLSGVLETRFEVFVKLIFFAKWASCPIFAISQEMTTATCLSFSS